MTVKYLAILDAGHAEKVLGKQSPCKTLREWDFCNKLQYEIKERLEKHGITVYLTNPSPQGINEIGLTKRCTLANSKYNSLGKPNTIFVSLHANALGDGSEFNSARGPVTFISKNCSSNSKKAAEIFQNELVEITKKLDPTSYLKRGVWEENFTVLCKTSMPAILLEYAFYTNKEDLKLLKENRSDYVESTVKAFCKYWGITYIGPTIHKENTSEIKNESCSFMVRIKSDTLNVRVGPGTSYEKVSSVKKGSAFTIVEKSTNNWGKLKSGLGWICLAENYVERI